MYIYMYLHMYKYISIYNDNKYYICIYVHIYIHPTILFPVEQANAGPGTTTKEKTFSHADSSGRSQVSSTLCAPWKKIQGSQTLNSCYGKFLGNYLPT